MKTSILALILLLLLGGIKEKDWQTGKLVELRDEPIIATSRARKYLYTVRAADYDYVASYQPTGFFRRTNEIQLTVNTSVKFALDKDSLYLIDEKNHEFKLRLEKKILREK